jgi:hypothetical protein
VNHHRSLHFIVAISLIALSPPAAAASSSGGDMKAMTGPVRIAYLHHSTGEIVWGGGVHRRVYRLWDRHVPDAVKRLVPGSWPGGVPDHIRRWNAEHGTDYRVSELTYPATTGGYPWANYPYDYWNLWVAHAGASRDRGELNLDDLVKDHDVIVFKHCFPVSRIVEDDGNPSVSSSVKTLANYKLQYEALKGRMRQFPDKRFVLWTGAALVRAGGTNPEQARRARQFANWVKGSWDEQGDNIFVWDFYELEADSEGFLAQANAQAPNNSHPSGEFGAKVAPLIARRIVDVIEGRGDSASIAGAPPEGPSSGHARAAGSR